VNHWGHSKLQYSPVTALSIDKEHDVAVLATVVETPKWILPFDRITPGVHWGQPVTCYGWPVDVFGPDTSKEQLRAFRGHVQRLFTYTGRLGGSYPAAELSFAAPPGLSGAPVFLDNEPKTIVGVVTENLASFHTLESFEEQLHGGGTRRVEYRAVITYGVAATLLYAVEFLEAHIPGLTLLPYTPTPGAEPAHAADGPRGRGAPLGRHPPWRR
jgi:hypothetical protein